MKLRGSLLRNETRVPGSPNLRVADTQNLLWGRYERTSNGARKNNAVLL